MDQGGDAPQVADEEGEAVNGIEMTIVGTLGRDFELRYTTSGRAVASCGVAVSRRWKAQDSQEWQEVTSWVNVTLWAEMAENAASSLKKGMRVICQGRFEQRSYEDKEGETKTVWEMTVDEIGPSLRWARVEVEKIEREKPAERAPSGGGGSPYPDPDEPF